MSKINYPPPNTLYENLSYDWSADSIRLFYTPSTMAKDTFFYVQETGFFKTAPSYYAERANLNSYLIIHTLSGQGHFTYDNKEYLLDPNQTCFFDCRKHHKYYCAANQEWNFLWLHFNGKNATAYYHAFAKGGSPLLMVADSVQIAQQLMQITNLTEHKSLHSELICSNLITNILTELIVQSSITDDITLLIPDYIQATLKFIDTHFHKKIRLDDLAYTIGISKYHLSREFKLHIGQTIIDYITDKRLNYAKELLRYSTLSISEIASQCGITHITHFINFFKRKEGSTPLAYRKEWT